MSYFKWKEYEVVPVTPYKIIRNCSGCGGRMTYINTGNFRINANAGKIDVWMIYQCEKCKHTYNLPIYERISPKALAKEEYKKFLENDIELINQYGTSMQLMKQNKIEIDWTQMEYELVGRTEDFKEQNNVVTIQNPYGLRLRTDKVVSQILHVSRQKIRHMVEQELLTFDSKNVGNTVTIRCREIGQHNSQAKAV